MDDVPGEVVLAVGDEYLLALDPVPPRRATAATFLDDDEKRAAVGYGSADPAARSAGDGR
jgi:hypothetical protein